MFDVYRRGDNLGINLGCKHVYAKRSVCLKGGGQGIGNSLGRECFSESETYSDGVVVDHAIHLYLGEMFHLQGE